MATGFGLSTLIYSVPRLPATPVPTAPTSPVGRWEAHYCPVIRTRLNGSKSTDDEYLRFPCLLCPAAGTGGVVLSRAEGHDRWSLAGLMPLRQHGGLVLISRNAPSRTDTVPSPRSGFWSLPIVVQVVCTWDGQDSMRRDQQCGTRDGLMYVGRIVAAGKSNALPSEGAEEEVVAIPSSPTTLCEPLGDG